MKIYAYIDDERKEDHINGGICKLVKIEKILLWKYVDFTCGNDKKKTVIDHYQPIGIFKRQRKKMTNPDPFLLSDLFYECLPEDLEGETYADFR